MERPLSIAHCVEAYAPAPGGMAEVVRQLSERMARQGHRVTVLTSAHPERPDGERNGVMVKGFAVRGNAVDGIAGDTQAYLAALRDGGFDVITFFAAQQWATDIVLPELAALHARKVFVPTGFSALRDARWAAYYRAMPEWLAAMDLNVFHSEGYQDAAFASSLGLRNTTLIPNGASEEEFSRPLPADIRRELGLRPDQQLIVHVGSYTGIKGHREALDLFVRARTGQAALLLIGNGVRALEVAFRRHPRYWALRLRSVLKGKRIEFREWERTRTVAAMRQADLFLFPSNVECSPIVLFESMAAGVPFLASDAGNAAEIARWSNGGWILPCMRDARGLVRPSMAAAARQLSSLLADPALLKRTGIAGQAAWRERFTWERIATRYLEEYQRLVSPTA
jgi:glycosyltransferase involved in cell wall biosynthesis